MRGGERGGSQTAHRLSMQEEGPRYDLRGARRGRDQAQGGSGHRLYEIDGEAHLSTARRHVEGKVSSYYSLDG